jgi:chaperone required for assembly of F1-ATPase
VENAPVKRFYQAVTIAQADGGWRVLLDGRGIKTPAGAAQVVPTQALADALAGEWRAQGETIDPATFPLRDLADYAIDVVTDERQDVVSSLIPYAETDTLCYRADPDEPLHRRQLEVWEPVLSRAEQRFRAQFTRVSGIVHKPQPPETLATLRTEMERRDPFTLAALRMTPPASKRNGRPNSGAASGKPNNAVPGGWKRSSWRCDLLGLRALPRPDTSS